MSGKRRYRVPAGSRREPAGGAAQRNFPAASSPAASTAGLTIGGMGGVTSPEIIRRQIGRIIATSRQAARAVDHVRALELMFRRHVIGPRGIRLISTIEDRSGEPDQDARDLVEDVWREWGELGSPTVCGGLAWAEIEHMAAMIGVARDGNLLLRIHEGPRFGPFGIQIEPILFDELAVDLVRASDGRTMIDGGIEFDNYGRRVAYHLRPIGRQRVTRRIPAADMLHFFLPTEPLQHFGLPAAITGLHRLRKLEEFEDAAVDAAYFAAANMLFFKRPADDDEEEPKPGERGDNSANVSSGRGADADREGDADRGDGGFRFPDRIEGGTVSKLPAGWEVETTPGHFPMTDPSPFVNHSLRGVAVGAGVSFGGISGNLENANYSTLRDGRSDERDEFRILQASIARRLHGPIFRRVIDRAWLRGVIPGDLAELRRHKRCEWRGRGWQAISPKDEATANESEVRLGVTSLSEIAARRGEDIEDVAKQLKRDLEVLVANGLLPPGATLADLGKPMAPAVAAAPNDDDAGAAGD